MQIPVLVRTPLFEGVPPADLDAIAQQMERRHFRARDVICQEGSPGESLFVIEDGLALVMISNLDSGEVGEGSTINRDPTGVPLRGAQLARLRRGDVVGEMSLITDEPRSATVVAAVPTTVLELSRTAFGAILTRYPAILLNLNRILSQRLARTNVHQAQSRRRGEALALLVGRSAASLVPAIVAATEAASPRSVAALDVRTGSDALASALGTLDDQLGAHGTAIVLADIEQESVPLLLDHMDRIVAVVSPAEARRLAGADTASSARPRQIEIALLGDGPGGPADLVGADLVRTAPVGAAPSGGPHMPVIRTMPQAGYPPAGDGRDIAWLGRHLARTKLGLALGAGGAKGYAHLGAIYALEQAGYTVDYVAGSSIGAMVGCWLGLGMTASQIDALMREAFSPENAAAMFKLSMAGTSAGLDVMVRICHETTQERSFADLVIPLVAMAVDLNTLQPEPICDGPLWEALLASTALAGMYPPYQRGDQRLVDGVALVPVPTGSVLSAGADIALSVNLMSREKLPAWPGEVPPEPAPAKAGSRMLEVLLEVMDLAQLDASVRHAALADVVVTPRFGPGSWRDFHLADLFLAAGREAAEEQLASLRSLARPQSSNLSRGEVHGTAVHV